MGIKLFNKKPKSKQDLSIKDEPVSMGFSYDEEKESLVVQIHNHHTDESVQAYFSQSEMTKLHNYLSKLIK